MDSNKKKPTKVGRPSKYTDDMPERLAKYFNVPLERDVLEEVPTKDGVTVVNRIKPNWFPSVEGFCASEFIARDTFYNWVKKYPEFSDIAERCKMVQMNFLMSHGLNGGWNANLAKFMIQNLSEYRDKVQTEVKGNIEIKLPDPKLTKL